jgi:hypothetical protein
VQEVRANRIYFVFGLVSGPAVGALTAWLSDRRRGLVPLVAGAVVASEIGVVALLQGRRLLPSPLYFAWGVDDWTPYVVEAAVGVSVLLVALLRAMGRASREART